MVPVDGSEELVGAFPLLLMTQTRAEHGDLDVVEGTEVGEEVVEQVPQRRKLPSMTYVRRAPKRADVARFPTSVARLVTQMVAGAGHTGVLGGSLAGSPSASGSRRQDLEPRLGSCRQVGEEGGGVVPPVGEEQSDCREPLCVGTECLHRLEGRQLVRRCSGLGKWI